MNITFKGQIKDMTKIIFGFDFDEQITIISTQIPFFKKYYSQLKKQYAEENYKIDYSIIDDNDKAKQFASSISIDIELEEKIRTDENIITSGQIKINNETKYSVDVEKLLNEPLKLNFNGSGPKVLIYHTHTTESYIKNLSQLSSSSLICRSKDPRENVVRVGDEIASDLRGKYGVEVIHNGTIHDNPNYNLSYSNAYVTASNILKSYPSIGIVLDIHRDAMEKNKKLRVVTKVNNKDTAKIMFVVSTGEVGLSHPDWKENLKLALRLQKKLKSINPDLTRPIYISKYRYNQHLSTGALTVEIGGEGNLLSECLESANYLSVAVCEIIDECK